MRPTIRIIGSLAVVPLLIAVTGCGTGNGSSNSSGSQSSSSGGGDSGPVTISFELQNSYLTSPQQANQFVSEFEKAYPNIKVNVTTVPDANLYAKERVQASTGSLPDVFQIANGGDSTAKLFSKQGYLADLSGLSSANNLSSAVKNGSMYGGKLADFSVGVGVLGLMYNEDLLKQVGFSSPPQTWSDLIKLGKALQQHNKKLLVYSGAWDTGAAPTFHWTFGNAAIQDPSFSKAYVSDSVNWNQPSNMKILTDGYQKFDQLNKYVLTGSFTDQYQVAQQDFVNGKAAMILAGTWDAGYIESLKPSFKVGFMNFPYDSNSYDSNSVVFVPEDGLAVNAKSPHLKAAETFLNWLFSKKVYTQINASKKNFSSETGIGKLDPMYTDVPSWLAQSSKVVPFGDTGPMPSQVFVDLGKSAQSTTFGTSATQAANQWIQEYTSTKG